MDQQDALRRGVAEALGAGALTFFGAGSIITMTGLGDVSLLTVALAHGLALGIMISAFGHVSGGHFNPAVTFGFLVTRRISAAMAGVYWISQLVGAVAAALLLRAVLDDDVARLARFGTPELAGGVSIGEGFLLEVIMTFALVLVVFATAVDKEGAFRIVAGFAIGLAVTVGILVGGPLTGAAMNPSRAFGPQLVGWIWSDAWLYYLAPLAGGALAALLYDRLYLKDQPPAP